MEVIFQNWIIALSAGIIAGSLIGLVMGHKLKEPMSKALSSPEIFQSGLTNKVLVGIALALVVVAFLGGILQGVAAIIVGYVTEIIVGTRVNNNNHKAGYGIAIKTALMIGLAIVLPLLLWGYYSYSRTPSESDKRSFVYDCTNYSIRKTFGEETLAKTRPAEFAIVAHQEQCVKLWNVLVGKYRAMGKINNLTRDGDEFGLYDSEAREIFWSYIKQGKTYYN